MEATYVCTVCAAPFETAGELASHLRDRHEPEQEDFLEEVRRRARAHVPDDLLYGELPGPAVYPHVSIRDVKHMTRRARARFARFIDGDIRVGLDVSKRELKEILSEVRVARAKLRELELELRSSLDVVHLVERHNKGRLS